MSLEVYLSGPHEVQPEGSTEFARSGEKFQRPPALATDLSKFCDWISAPPLALLRRGRRVMTSSIGGAVGRNPLGHVRLGVTVGHGNARAEGRVHVVRMVRCDAIVDRDGHMTIPSLGPAPVDYAQPQPCRKAEDGRLRVRSRPLG